MLYINRLSVEESGNPKGDITGIDCASIEENVRQYMKEVTFDENKVEIKHPNMKILKQELKKGRLRQGWGLGLNGLSMDLRNSTYNTKKNRWEPADKWIEDTIELYRLVWDEKIKCKQAVGRFRIISRLLDIEPTDIVFIPKVPSDDMFTVAAVKKGYDFAQIDGYVGHGHIIRVRDVAEYEYDDDTLPAIIFARHCRSGINRIRKENEFLKFLRKEKYL